jgi:hypothetical protein
LDNSLLIAQVYVLSILLEANMALILLNKVSGRALANGVSENNKELITRWWKDIDPKLVENEPRSDEPRALRL